jgi:hypothetical protein
MRLAFALVAAAVVACSSADDDGDDCAIVGTYSMSTVLESGSCGAGMSGGATTVSSDPAGGYRIEVAGLPGGCHATSVSACKIQSNCDAVILDALNANQRTATVQHSLTFDAAGFKGSLTIAMPPAKSLPSGCLGTYQASGARR